MSRPSYYPKRVKKSSPDGPTEVQMPFWVWAAMVGWLVYWVLR